MSVLDSSLPTAVRKSFVLVAGFAAAGGKARHQHIEYVSRRKATRSYIIFCIVSIIWKVL